MDSGHTEAYRFKQYEGANFAGALVHPVRVVLASGPARPHSFPVRLVTVPSFTPGGHDGRCSLRAVACSSFSASQTVGRQAIVLTCQTTFTSFSCLHFFCLRESVSIQPR